MFGIKITIGIMTDDQGIKGEDREGSNEAAV